MSLVRRNNALVKSPSGKGLALSPCTECCGGCFYYRASLCNETICPGAQWPDIFVCTTYMCDENTPLVDGQVIRYGERCYTVHTGVIYCPQSTAVAARNWLGRFLRWTRTLTGKTDSPGQGSQGPPPSNPLDDCIPLPPNAIIGDANFNCIPVCSLAQNCRPIDGWFTLTPCPCPGGFTGNFTSYVCCTAYLNAINLGRCPVWVGTSSTGQSVCATVRPGTNPTTDPQTGAELICTDPQFNSCCACCGTNGGTGCCYGLVTQATTTWTNGVPVVVTGPQTNCCWSRQAYNASGSVTCISQYNCPLGTGECPISVRVATAAGTNLSITNTTYNQGSGGCPSPPQGCGGITSGPTVTNYDITCMSAADVLALATGDFQTGGQSQTGTQVLRCDTASIAISTDGAEGGGFGTHGSKNGSFSVSGGEACGEFNCNPLVGTVGTQPGDDF